MFHAAEAKSRAQWADWSYALHWILAAMPNMSSKARPIVTPEQINPYTANEPASDKIPLTTNNPAARAALDAWAERSAARGQHAS